MLVGMGGKRHICFCFILPLLVGIIFNLLADVTDVTLGFCFFLLLRGQLKNVVSGI